MALDGIFLSKVKDELNEKAVGLKVDKVQQPTRDEIVLLLRGRQGNYRLLICVRADSPRIHFVSNPIDNPPVPPMFCMLLRKHLTGAVITRFRQHELDRILFIDFCATNEIGDKVGLSLCVEIMGKYSNLILLTEEGKIIDCIKRIDLMTSSVRQILPGMMYELPPAQDKISIEKSESEQLVHKILQNKNKLLSSAVMCTVQGISPIAAREIAFYCTGEDQYVNTLSDECVRRLEKIIDEIKTKLHTHNNLYMVCTENNVPKEFSFIEINQYGTHMKVKHYDSCSMLLDDFYFERDRVNRINHRAHELIKLLNNLIERCIRKINIQREELKKCAEKETLRLYGELITANIHRFSKGQLFYEAENYYDSMKIIRIPANPALSPLENADKYYKDYRKAKTAQVMLEKFIVKAEAEIDYLESVLDEISRADTDSEISAIRHELCEGGYIKEKSAKKQKVPKELPVLEYRSTDGFRILVGRNNVQNDKLSLKTANKNDMWLHTQNIPGSHVIIVSDNKAVSDLSIEQAACIAAVHSKAKDSSLVPVDYTKVRALKKPVGAKPGKVIYHEYYTIITKPDKELSEKLRIK